MLEWLYKRANKFIIVVSLLSVMFDLWLHGATVASLSLLCAIGIVLMSLKLMEWERENIINASTVTVGWIRVILIFIQAFAIDWLVA